MLKRDAGVQGIGWFCLGALLSACSGTVSDVEPVGSAAESIDANPQVVISQVYGGGQNTPATYSTDYLELFNRSNQNVSLASLSLQYTSASGNGLFGQAPNLITPLPSVTLVPGEYFLVYEGSGTGTSLPLPNDAPDTSPISMGAPAGKVALVRSTAPLGCNGGSTPCKDAQKGLIIDLVGYGVSANFFEGIGPAPAPSTTTAIYRNSGGCGDTNNNANDFSTATPSPRGSGTPHNQCF